MSGLSYSGSDMAQEKSPLMQQQQELTGEWLNENRSIDTASFGKYPDHSALDSNSFIDNKWRRMGFQFGIFMLTFVNYGILHATRSSWSMATKDLLNLYNWSENTISDMNATFLFTYSLGGFFLSHLGDIYSKRKLICFMYTIIALAEVALGCLQFIAIKDQSAAYFYIVKAINGAVQSFAWAVNFGILSNWFPRKGRGILIGIWATNPSVGDIFGQRIYLMFTENNVENWGYTFIFLGGCIEVVAILNLLCLVEYPLQKGIVIRERANILDPTKVDDDTNISTEAENENEINQDELEDNAMTKPKIAVEDNEDIKNISFGKALFIPGVLTYSLSFFFIKFAYYGIYYWVPTYLQDELGYSKDQAGNITSLGSVGGIIGSLLMGLLSDVLVVRSPVHSFGCIIGALCLCLITSVHDDQHTSWLTFLLTSFSIFEGGATIVISIILCDIGKDYVQKHQLKAIATISGICDGIAGFGSILGQLLLGPVEAQWGWTMCFAMFSVSSIAACLPTIPFTFSEVRKFFRQRKSKQEILLLNKS